MKITLAATLIFTLFCSLTVGLQADFAKADFEVIFSEDFNSSIVDPTKWIVQENTNISGYLAYGGKVTLNNGKIFLSSDGSSFPYIKTATDPFSLVEDFILEFNFTYIGISDFGNGLWLTAGSPRIWYNDPSKELATQNIFSLWADNKQSYNRSRISIDLLEKEVWTTYVSGWEPNAPTYTFRLEYIDNTYTVFVDDAKVASAQSQLKPNTISFGHPPAIYVPFSTAHIQSLIGGWTSFTIDYIKVLNPSGLVPTSTYTQIPALPSSTVSSTVPPNLSSNIPIQPHRIDANPAPISTSEENIVPKIIIGTIAVAAIISVLTFFIKYKGFL